MDVVTERLAANRVGRGDPSVDAESDKRIAYVSFVVGKISNRLSGFLELLCLAKAAGSRTVPASADSSHHHR
jgi:hypothetical protein